LSEPVVTAHLQDSIVQLAITSTDFLKRARPAIDPAHFQPPASDLLDVALKYYDNFSEAAGDHFQDEFAPIADELDDDQYDLYMAYIDRVNDLDTPNVDYILDKLNSFARARALQSGLLEAADHVADGDFLQAENVMHEAFHAGVESVEMGYDYLYDFSDLPDRMTGEQYLMKTGIKALDKMVGGFKRGDFGILEGEYKGKKSWGLLYIAMMGLRHGLNVLYISHENSEEETRIRLDRMIGWLSKERGGKEVDIYGWDNDSESVVRKTKKCRSIYNLEASKKARLALRKWGGRIFIKKYPMSSVNMLEIRRYINCLEAYKGFVPDLIVNDYADKMAPMDSRKSELAQLTDTYQQHKRLADELNCVVFTASQVDTGSIRRGTITKASAYGHKGKLGDCDVAFGLDPQTPAQIETGETVLRVIAARNSKESGVVTFWKCLDAGQFCVDSIVGRVNSDDDDEDDE